MASYQNDGEFFEAAVRCNTGHGCPLSEWERKSALLKLQHLGISRDKAGPSCFVADTGFQQSDQLVHLESMR
jgi:hypothetical protein